MVNTCCAVGCTNRYKKGGIPFHRFPSNPERYEQWVKAINRINVDTKKTWHPNEEDRVCGVHFQTGRASTDKNHPDYVPNVFNVSSVLKEVKKRRRGDAELYESRKRRLHDRVIVEARQISDEQDTFHWTGQAVRFLITARSEMDGTFNKARCKKKTLWEEVAKKLNAAGNHNVCASICDRKWRNLLNTYRRIKDSNTNSGSETVRWEYYDLLDEWSVKNEVSSVPEDAVSERLEGFTYNSISSPSPLTTTTKSPKYKSDDTDITAKVGSKTSAFTRHKLLKRRHQNEPSTRFKSLMKQYTDIQDKLYELEERRLELDAAQVKAMQSLVAAVTTELRKQNTTV